MTSKDLSKIQDRHGAKKLKNSRNKTSKDKCINAYKFEANEYQ